MKRLIALFLILLVCVSLLTACSGTCELCGEEGRVYDVNVGGQERKLCESCKDGINALQNAFG